MRLERTRKGFLNPILFYYFQFFVDTFLRKISFKKRKSDKSPFEKGKKEAEDENAFHLILHVQVTFEGVAVSKNTPNPLPFSLSPCPPLPNFRLHFQFEDSPYSPTKTFECFRGEVERRGRKIIHRNFLFHVFFLHFFHLNPIKLQGEASTYPRTLITEVLVRWRIIIENLLNFVNQLD